MFKEKISKYLEKHSWFHNFLEYHYEVWFPFSFLDFLSPTRLTVLAIGQVHVWVGQNYLELILFKNWYLHIRYQYWYNLVSELYGSFFSLRINLSSIHSSILWIAQRSGKITRNVYLVRVAVTWEGYEPLEPSTAVLFGNPGVDPHELWLENDDL